MMRALLCSLLFVIACSNPGPAAPESPKAAPESPKAPEAAPPVDADLAAQVTKKFSEKCHLERSCGELLGIDCGAAVDGPYFYVRKSDLEIVARCGGFCMGGGCTNCPPAEWTCPTY